MVRLRHRPDQLPSPPARISIPYGTIKTELLGGIVIATADFNSLWYD